MEPAGRIKWIMRMVVMSCFALASISLAQSKDFGEGRSRAVGVVTAATPSPRSAPSVEKGYRYQYFPDARVYFDPSRELFFYMFNGEWTKSPVLPRELRNRLEDFVIIEMDDDDPYRFDLQAMRPRSRPLESGETGGRLRTYGESTPALAYRYYYYPRDQVYFNPENNAYFYFREGRWQRSRDLPAQVHEPLGDYVIIETDTDLPYTYHGQVLQMYFKQAKEHPKEETMVSPWEPKRGDPVYRYLYYPPAFVYFDEDRRVYFYYAHEQWVEAVALPAYLSKNLGNPVELRMSTAQPYQFHSQVIERYPHPGTAVNKSKPVFQIWSGKE